MTVTVTKIIDPDSGTGFDYTSLSAWEAAQQGDLTGVRDEIAIAKCRSTSGTDDTTATMIDGFTTDATRYIKIWTDTAESYRHAGIWNSSKYVLAVSGSYCIWVNDDYVIVDGLQLSTTASNAAFNIGSGITATNNKVVLSNTICKGPGDDTGNTYLINASNPNVNLFIYNALAYGVNPANTNSRVVVVNHASATLNIYSSTLIGGNVCLRNVAGTVVAKNVYAGNAGGSCYSGTITQTTCASSDTTAAGTALDSIAVNTTNFTNVTGGSENFHLPAGSALIDVGTDTSGDGAPMNFTTDVDGATRSGSWDIGFDEVTAAAGRTTKNTRSNPLGVAYGMTFIQVQGK